MTTTTPQPPNLTGITATIRARQTAGLIPTLTDTQLAALDQAEAAQLHTDLETTRWNNIHTTIATHVPRRYQTATPTVPAVATWADRISLDPHPGPSLLLHGPLGRGKTRNAYAAYQRIVASRSGHTITFITASGFAAAMTDFERRNVAATTTELAETDVLILDDLGVAKPSDWQSEHLYDVINSRYEHERATLITTNLETERAFIARLGDSGARIASRVLEWCEQVHVGGADWRAA